MRKAQTITADLSERFAAHSERAEPYAARSKYYVYAIIDPRDGSPFYVGKGSGNRGAQHARMARRGTDPNARKACQFHAIWDSGRQPTLLLLGNDLNEMEAFALERRLIAEFRAILTNQEDGKRTRRERSKDDAAAMLARIKPFAQWRAERQRTEHDIAIYHGVLKELAVIAAHGAVREVFIRPDGLVTHGY